MYHPVPRGDRDEGQDVELEDIGTLDSSAGRSDEHGHKPATIWLLILFLINSVSFGLIAVPRVNLVVSLVCRHFLSPSASDPPLIIGGHNPQCSTPDVSAKTAVVVTYGLTIGGILSSVVSPLLGRWSDRVGRVKAMMCNLTGLIAADAVGIMIASSPDTFEYRWLYLAFALDGLSGSFATAMSLSTAYISDCNPEEKRNVHIGRLYGSMFIGISVGPALSSIVTKIGGNSHPLLVFYIALAMRVMSMAYLAFIPESLPYLAESVGQSLKQAYRSRWSSSLTPRNVWNSLRSLHPGAWLDKLAPPGTDTAGRFRTNIVLLIVIDIIIYGGAVGPADVLILYPQVAFKWSNFENNIFLSVINAFRAAVTTLALPMLVRIFRGPSGGRLSRAGSSKSRNGADSLDRTLIRTAILCDMAGFIAYAVSPNGVLYTIGGALAAFGAIGLSTTEAALTKHIDASRNGELLGGLGFLQGLVRIIAPGAANLIYSWTADSIPQMAFLSVAVGLSVAAALTFLLKVRAPG